MIDYVEALVHAGMLRDEAEHLLDPLLDRIATIADEAFGLSPVRPVNDSLTAIERGIADLRVEHGQYRRDFEAMSARAAELAARVSELEDALLAEQGRTSGATQEAVRWRGLYEQAAEDLQLRDFSDIEVSEREP